MLDCGVFNADPMITDLCTLDYCETAFASLWARQDRKALVHPNGRSRFIGRGCQAVMHQFSGARSAAAEVVLDS